MHAGLEALAGLKPDVVLIHDAARPFVSAALISRAIDAAGRTGAAIPAIPVADTIKLIGETGPGLANAVQVFKTNAVERGRVEKEAAEHRAEAETEPPMGMPRKKPINVLPPARPLRRRPVP